MRIPFAVQSYQSRSLPVSAQQLVNVFPEAQPPDAKAPIALFSTPGLVSFATAGIGPIRGAHNMNGTLYVVSGTELYSITSTGTATLKGTVPGPDAVQMADDGTNLVMVTNGWAYIYDGSSVAAVSDPDFPGASSVVFLDNYFVFTRPGSGQFFLSSLADPTSYDALDFATAESAPDDTVRVEVDHSELILFGEETIEVWTNTGASDFPFERRPGATMEVGCGAAGSVVKMDATLFWLGDDLMVYRLNGQQPERVSHHAIEAEISGYETTSDAIAFSYVHEGHTFYVLTFPAAAKTWCYDTATGMWHERESRSGTTNLGRWRANCYASAYGKHFVGDYANSTVWEMDTETYTEGSETIVRTVAGPPIFLDCTRAFMRSFQLDLESGVGLETGQGSDPQAMLQWSNDGGRTWSNEHWAGMGAQGQYRYRTIWRRLGSFQGRIGRTMRVQISDPVKVVILGAFADVVEGG